MTGQENERSTPLYLYEKGERSTNYDLELAALLSQPWSEGACWGYMISAMKRYSFKPTDIEQVMLELYETFDYTTPEGAAVYYERNPYRFLDKVSRGHTIKWPAPYAGADRFLYPYRSKREIFYTDTSQIREQDQSCRFQGSDDHRQECHLHILAAGAGQTKS